MDYNMILAIAAVGALIISVVSLVITGLSIKKQEEHNRNSISKQEEHNKNSLKPICSIYQTNYENFISVRIENDGTGPLIINKIIFDCDDNLSYQSIFDLFKLSDIDLNQMEIHRIFPSIDRNNYALSPNERMYLLSVTPKDENTREKLRNKLKTLTVCVEFSDIYGNMYERKMKKLDIFGSEYEGISIKDVEKYILWS